MNSNVIIGIVLIISGISVFAVSQILLRRWMKKYNNEWMEGAEKK
ncbi:MAG: hypothetical protein UFA98_12045 [Ruminococcus sp.]|nr:hypothetical protein [Ruminococcus sp.]